MTHPNLVTAAIMYSWGAWLMPSEATGPLDFAGTQPELYLTLGRRDLDNHLTCVRDAYTRLKAKGNHLIYREFDELGDRTYHPLSNDNAIAWATRLRNKNIAPSPEEKKLLAAFKGAPPAPVDGYYVKLALVGGSPAGAVVQTLLDSKDAGVRAAAAETCSHAIFDEATTAALVKKISDPSVPVRQAAIRALAMYADWRYDAAQQALIRLATDTNADAGDRLDATDGLAYAVRLQVKGYRQDPPMFAALISLMHDKEEPVAATANGTLAPLYEFTRTGENRRRTPEGGWDKWLADVTAQETGDLKDYAACGFGKTEHQATYPGNGTEPVDLFCAGGSALMGYNLATCQAGKKDPVTAFQDTLKAAEKGYVPAEAAVGMMYANGKGVQQNYAEAGKWWVKASEGGDLLAARHAWNLYRNGEGVDRNPTVANPLAKLIGEPIPAPRTQTQKK
jgi:TPR repeat protein